MYLVIIWHCILPSCEQITKLIVGLKLKLPFAVIIVTEHKVTSLRAGCFGQKPLMITCTPREKRFYETSQFRQLFKWSTWTATAAMKKMTRIMNMTSKKMQEYANCATGKEIRKHVHNAKSEKIRRNSNNSHELV